MGDSRLLTLAKKVASLAPLLHARRNRLVCVNVVVKVMEYASAKWRGVS